MFSNSYIRNAKVLLALAVVAWNLAAELVAQDQTSQQTTPLSNAPASPPTDWSAPRLPDSILQVDGVPLHQVATLPSEGQTSGKALPQRMLSAPRLPNRVTQPGSEFAARERWQPPSLTSSSAEDWQSFGAKSLLVSDPTGITRKTADEKGQTVHELLNSEEAPVDLQTPKLEMKTATSRQGEFGSESAITLQNASAESVVFPVTLRQAITHSLTQKQVIHTLGSQVAVDLTTPLDPLIAAEQVNIAQARFDPTWRTAIGSDHIDLPPASFTPDGLAVTTQRDEGEFLTRITKEWATGATTSIGYEPSLAYLFLPQGNPGGFNPSHAADFVIQGTQPLLRNGGRNTNLASIRIANVREKQSVLLLQSKLQSQLKGIVTVYWNLHASHVRHAALTEAFALADQMYRLENRRFQAGRVIYADVARVGVNREGLIQQRLETERVMQQQTFQLSQMAGFPIAPSAILYPTDAPIHEAPVLDLDGILSLALSQNPKLLIQRNDLVVTDNELQVARNQLKPQLDLKSAVRSGGLNDDFGSALKDAAQVEFVNVAVGVEYSRPIGNRSAQAKYRQLQLAQSRNSNLLNAFEENVAYEIAETANSVKIEYAKFESALRRLAEAQEWVRLSKARYENPPDELGSDALLIALIDYQNAIQARVDALFITAQTLADYNRALCEIEELEGILLNNWGISFYAEPNAPQPPAIQPSPSSPQQVGATR
jgi:outer membrane protein TolC